MNREAHVDVLRTGETDPREIHGRGHSDASWQLVGVMVTPELAQLVCDAVNAWRLGVGPHAHGRDCDCDLPD